MNDKNTLVVRAGGIGLVGLIVLFWNFDNNPNDLYDAMYHFLMK